MRTFKTGDRVRLIDYESAQDLKPLFMQVGTITKSDFSISFDVKFGNKIYPRIHKSRLLHEKEPIPKVGGKAYSKSGNVFIIDSITTQGMLCLRGVAGIRIPGIFFYKAEKKNIPKEDV